MKVSVLVENNLQKYKIELTMLIKLSKTCKFHFKKLLDLRTRRIKKMKITNTKHMLPLMLLMVRSKWFLKNSKMTIN
jgi:hypothetical protein